MRTVAGEGEGSHEAKGSRFRAWAVPGDRFDDRLAALSNENRKASHVVHALRRFDGSGSLTERARDDGEPGGTAGMPMLRVLQGEGVVEAGVVCARWFGGTKLGTGGLARAYAAAARAALDAARLATWEAQREARLRAPHARASTLEVAVAGLGLTVLERAHDEHGVTLDLRGAASAFDHPDLTEFRS